MNMDVTPPPTTALEMRHEYLVEQQQSLARQLDQTELAWWRQAQDRLDQSPDANTLATLSGLCKRHLRERAVTGSDGWSTVQLARALLLAQAVEHHPEAQPAFLEQQFQWGDDQEKRALLSMLSTALDCAWTWRCRPAEPATPRYSPPSPSTPLTRPAITPRGRSSNWCSRPSAWDSTPPACSA